MYVLQVVGSKGPRQSSGFWRQSQQKNKKSARLADGSNCLLRTGPLPERLLSMGAAFEPCRRCGLATGVTPRKSPQQVKEAAQPSGRGAVECHALCLLCATNRLRGRSFLAPMWRRRTYLSRRRLLAKGVSPRRSSSRIQCLYNPRQEVVSAPSSGAAIRGTGRGTRSCCVCMPTRINHVEAHSHAPPHSHDTRQLSRRARRSRAHIAGSPPHSACNARGACTSQMSGEATAAIWLTSISEWRRSQCPGVSRHETSLTAAVRHAALPT